MELILIILINLFNGLGSFMINPVTSAYFVDRGLAFQYTGLFSSIMSYVSLAFRPFSGSFSDSFNQKKLMLYSYMGMAACMFLYVVSADYRMSLVIRICHGIAFAISTTVSLAFASSFIPEDKMAQSMGVISMGNMLGQMFGPQLGSMVADGFGIDMVFICAGILNLIVLILICILPYKNKDDHERKKLTFSIRNLIARQLLVYMLLVFILSYGNGTLSYYLKSYGDYKGITNISLFYTVSSVVLLIFKPILGKVQDQKGVQYILYPGYVITALSMLLIANAHSLLPVLIAAALKGIGQGCSSAAIQAEGIRILGKKQSGVAVSTIYLGMDIGNAIGPTLSGYQISKMGYETMLYTNAVLLMIGFVIFHFYYRSQKKQRSV